MSCPSMGLGGVVFFASRYNYVHHQHPSCAALRVRPLDLHWIVHAPNEETVVVGPAHTRTPASASGRPPTAEGGVVGWRTIDYP